MGPQNFVVVLLLSNNYTMSRPRRLNVHVKLSMGPCMHLMGKREDAKMNGGPRMYGVKSLTPRGQMLIQLS